MKRKLAELSLKELWRLFPIILTAHQDCWANWFKEEAGLLRENLPDVGRISHIGSTAIKGIWAKPIIDILMEVPRKERLSNLQKVILYKDLPNKYSICTYLMREITMNCISGIIFKQILLSLKNMNNLNLIYGSNISMTGICTLYIRGIL